MAEIGIVSYEQNIFLHLSTLSRETYSIFHIKHLCTIAEKQPYKKKNMNAHLEVSNGFKITCTIQTNFD